MLRHACIALTLIFAGCSDDAASAPATAADSGSDTSTAVDTAVVDPDTAAATDSAMGSDAADSAVVDSGTKVDAATDEGLTGDATAACHAVGFGAPAATIAKVSSLPTMTGGTIVNGIYDAVAVTTTGSTTGTYRATWSFVAGMKIEPIEQLAISSSPPPPVPRILTWSRPREPAATTSSTMPVATARRDATSTTTRTSCRERLAQLSASGAPPA